MVPSFAPVWHMKYKATILNDNTPQRDREDTAPVQANWQIRTPYTPLSSGREVLLSPWRRAHRASLRSRLPQQFLVMPTGGLLWPAAARWFLTCRARRWVRA